MRSRRQTLVTLVASCALLAPASTAYAAGLPINLLQNPDAETGAGATGSEGKTPPPGWSVTGDFSVVQYGASGGFPEATVASAIGGGKNFFSGGNEAVSTATQTVDVSSFATAIDAGHQAVTLSGDLGGYSTQGDNMVVTATYLNVTGGSLGTLTIGPVTAEERKDETTLLARTTNGTVPAGTRSIQVTMTSTRLEGAYDDGYGDNIVLSLAAAEAFGPSGVVQAPSDKQCLSRRSFTIHIRQIAGLVYKQVAVYVNKHRVQVTSGVHATAPVDLRGLPKGRYTVRIVVTTTSGQQITGTRSYHTCARKAIHPKGKSKL
ncbi:MAG TPA: hypothetical protein VGG08_10835 [Solirubrobacteraceae bacterium]|jgi:hypothetical protein